MKPSCTYLYPADFYADKTPALVSTVLGSCVSVCLYDATLKIGAINHFILPYWNGQDLSMMKYGNTSIIRLIEEMGKSGSQYNQIVARIYGGAEVLSGYPTSFHIGERNIKAAFEILSEFQIPIVHASVGGTVGRKIVFDTITGEVTERSVRGIKEGMPSQEHHWMNLVQQGADYRTRAVVG